MYKLEKEKNIVDFYISHIDNSIQKSYLNISKMDEGVKAIIGFIGFKMRHFLNNLMSLENINYLEIGAFLGASSCSALSNNKINAIIIDNFSEFGDNKETLISNLNKFSNKSNLTFFDKDCFEINKSLIYDIDIYYYDGNHEEINQYKALEYYIDCMKDTFIYMVDDWNLEKVRNGTLRAIEDLKLKVCHKREFFTKTTQNEQGYLVADAEGWWNGFVIFILQKN